jgi:SAM-dependent methyltransferase
MSGEHWKAAPTLARALGRGLWRRLRHPREAPHQKSPVSLAGIEGAERFPAYYLHAFHGQENGYLSQESAHIYDLGLWAYFLGQEGRVRASLVDRVPGEPRRILDLGCGTGASTFALAKRFPQAELWGVDLSPFMLERARQRSASLEKSRVCFAQQNAEHLSDFETASFDLVSSSFLQHEVPRSANRAIFREAARLLRPGGILAILDEPQLEDTRLVAYVPSLIGEPHYEEYSAMSFPEELAAAGFVDASIRRGLATKTIVARRS